MKASQMIIFLVTTFFYMGMAFADNNTAAIVGDYKCQRTNSANNMTSYPLNIKQTGQTYTLEWSDTNGSPVMYGTAVMHPNSKMVLPTTFWDLANTESNGLEIFSIKDDGSLQGNWLLQSTKDHGTEVCTKG